MTLPKIKPRDILILTLIVLFGLCLRVYKLSFMVNFDFDQEYATEFAKTILQIYPIAMIGQGLSVQGLFMGPFYFYFLVPFFALTHLHPIGGYIGSIVVSLGQIIAAYFLLKHIFGKVAGYIGALLSATLLLYIQYSWYMAPTYSGVIVIIATWFCLYKYWHSDQRYVPLLAFIFGMYTSIHPIFFPFYFVFILIALMRRKIPKFSITIYSLILFVIPLAPLLAFEYFRNFAEVKTLLSLRGSSASEPKTIALLIDYAMILFRFPMELFHLPFKGMVANVISGLFYLTPIILWVKNIGFWKDRFHIVMVLSSIIMFLGYYYLLPTHVPEYYFIGVQSIIFIYAAATLALLLQTKARWVGIVLLGIVLYFNITGLVSLWQHPGGHSLGDKLFILQTIKDRQKDNQNFDVTQNIDYGQHYGFGYLTRLLDIKATGEHDTVYEIVLPTTRTKEKIDILSPSGGIGLIIRTKNKE
jgi:hypothetical protein